MIHQDDFKKYEDLEYLLAIQNNELRKAANFYDYNQC